jgi:cytochrome c biogenesis protein CcdA
MYTMGMYLHIFICLFMYVYFSILGGEEEEQEVSSKDLYQGIFLYHSLICTCGFVFVFVSLYIYMYVYKNIYMNFFIYVLYIYVYY